MDNKNNLVSNQLDVEHPHCLSDIYTWHRNGTTIFADDVLHIWSNSIFFTKRSYHWNRGVDYRIFR